MTKAELLEEIVSLSEAVEGRELSEAELEKVSADVRALKNRINAPKDLDPSRLRELKGLGKELWRSLDVDEYIRRERDYCDR